MKLKKYSLILFLLIATASMGLIARVAKADDVCGSATLHQDPQTKLCVPNDTGSNGITGATSVNDLVIRVINVLLTVAAIIAVLFIVVGGFRYITSNGNEDEAKKGRKTIMYALIGLAAVIISYTLVTVVNNVVSNCGGFASVWFGC